MKKISKIIVGILVAAIVGGGIYVWTSGSTREPVNPNLNAPTVALARTDMVNTVSASGAVESATTTNIYPAYSAQTYPIMEILVETGDAVKKGDVLARLDMSKLEDEIEQAELNLMNTEATAEEERRLAANAVETAETALRTSQISLDRQLISTANAEKDLLDAQTDMEEPFDSYTYDKLIDDTRLAVERAEDALETARDNLADLLDNEFDGLDLQNAVRDMQVLLERAEADLIDARDDLDEELADEKTFDPYEYQNAINDAQRAYDRAKDAVKDAEDALEEAEDYYEDMYYSENVPDTVISAAEQSALQAESALEAAEKAEEDALTALRRAQSDKTKAEADFKDNNQDTKSDLVKTKENAVETFTRSFSDAQRKYDDAVQKLADETEDWTEEHNDQIDAAGDAVTTAENSLFDARRAYEKALSDKEHAIEDYIELNEDALEAAERLYTDSQEQLASVNNSVTQASVTLEQAENKPDNTATSIDIQRLNLKKLYTNLAEGEIIATADGVITENNAKVGALPAGIMFVIEDADDLYVSANIKEYSLSQVSVGQEAIVTTDATGDAAYDATVDYISPKAVSPAGSTSVEFEIRASFDAGDEDAVRIGMNAFVNVITQTRENVYSVPLSAVVTDERGAFVYSPNGAERTEIPVEVGIRTVTQAEISGEGLTDGLEILIQPVEMPVSEMPSGFMMG